LTFINRGMIHFDPNAMRNIMLHSEEEDNDIYIYYVMITGIIQPLYNQILKSSSSVGRLLDQMIKILLRKKLFF
jgi:hypothetical protein